MRTCRGTHDLLVDLGDDVSADFYGQAQLRRGRLLVGGRGEPSDLAMRYSDVPFVEHSGVGMSPPFESRSASTEMNPRSAASQPATPPPSDGASLDQAAGVQRFSLAEAEGNFNSAQKSLDEARKALTEAQKAAGIDQEASDAARKVALDNVIWGLSWAGRFIQGVSVSYGSSHPSVGELSKAAKIFTDTVSSILKGVRGDSERPVEWRWIDYIKLTSQVNTLLQVMNKMVPSYEYKDAVQAVLKNAEQLLVIAENVTDPMGSSSHAASRSSRDRAAAAAHARSSSMNDSSPSQTRTVRDRDSSTVDTTPANPMFAHSGARTAFVNPLNRPPTSAPRR